MRCRHAALFCLCIVTIGLIAVKPAGFPPVWFDEGWNLSVARNWAEKGTYAQLLNGKPVPADMLAVGSPAVLPVAIVFKFLGVGIWQGRFPFVLYTLAALALLYLLARNLYNESVAIGALAVVLLMSGRSELHPVLLGKQALGEMPAMFFLLAGYACFLAVPRRPALLTPLTALLWALAALTKPQVLPFLLVSLACVVLLAALARRWRTAALVAVIAGVCLAMYVVLQGSERVLLQHETSYYTTGGILSVAIIVLALVPRLVAALILVGYGMPTLVATLFTARRYFVGWSPRSLDAHREVVRLGLLALVGSWLAWYALGSIGWARYLFPAVFMGSIFVSATIYEWTEGFNLRRTLNRSASALRRLRMDPMNRGALIAVALVLFGVPITVTSLYRDFLEADTSAVQVTNDLNAQTPADALIETFDGELFFLLNRRYHYPPRQTQVQLNRRTFLQQNAAVDYDPLESDPDYLVVGPQSKLWGLYADVLTSGQFRLLTHYPRYDVYQRVR